MVSIYIRLSDYVSNRYQPTYTKPAVRVYCCSGFFSFTLLQFVNISFDIDFEQYETICKFYGFTFFSTLMTEFTTLLVRLYKFEIFYATKNIV